MRPCRSSAFSRRTTRSLRLAAPLLGHFGEHDDTAPPDVVATLAARIEQESGVTPGFRQYPAGHAFLNDANGLGTYDAEQATLVWDAPLDFLRTHVR